MTSGPSHLGDALSALVDGELGPDGRARAREHLADCPECSAELHEVTQARAWVRALPAVDPPFGFYERVTSRRRRNLARLAPVAVAASTAAALFALVGLTSPREQPVQPAVPRLVQVHAAASSVGDDPLSGLAPVGVPVAFGR